VAPNLPAYVGADAIGELIRYLRAQHLDHFTLVADGNTYRVLGEAIQRSLDGEGFDARAVVLPGKEIIPDEHSVMQILVQAGRESRTYLAVGSGTVNDLTRFVSHRARSDFISIPTAPSVDAYTSPTSSLILAGLKQTVLAQPPIAIFADLPTLCAAPRSMIASGFGDMLGKFTSLADWRLGHLLWDEPYSEAVAQRLRAALEGCIHHVEAIGRGDSEGIRALMDGLLESGRGMLEFGNGRPAAGSEHYVSHYLDMKLIWENRPAVLHGAKVGLATLGVAKRYEQIAQLTRQQAADRLRASVPPDRTQEVERIRTAYPPIADQIVAEQAPFLNLAGHAYNQLKEKITEQWDKIQDIAAAVPPSDDLASLFRTVGGATEPAGLGLGEAELALALEVSHYLRNHFTVLKLNRILGL
jgi:glycerol-1-phosphate dehydrogenase [NAD(P)+]